MSKRTSREHTTALPFRYTDPTTGVSVVADTLRYFVEPTRAPRATRTSYRRPLSYYVARAEAIQRREQAQYGKGTPSIIRVPRIEAVVPTTREDHRQTVARKYAERAARSKWL